MDFACAWHALLLFLQACHRMDHVYFGVVSVGYVAQYWITIKQKSQIQIIEIERDDKC